jgi:hypothetical protein
MTTPRNWPGTAVRGAAALVAVCGALFLATSIAQAPPPMAPPPMPPATGASPASSAAQAPPSITAIECGVCGTVESIRQTTATQQWTPLGTGVGVGGVSDLGSAPAGVTSYRIGPGLSNQGMVVLGSAGGAAYKKTPNSYERLRWEVTVKLFGGGGVRIVTLSYEPYVHEGDRVRIAGNNVELLE